ncbi:MAG: hypothetical protein WBE76_31960 [Terracidiphilus sp.]
MESGRPKCFVAYASSLPGKGDAIEAAVSEINQGGIAEVTSWTTLNITGRPIIGAICEEIRQSNLVIADITNLNPNVLFELGFAATQNKRLFLIFNPKVAGAKALFERFQLLTTVCYSAYTNSHEIVAHFYKEEPYKKLKQTLLADLAQSATIAAKRDSLLYIKPEVSTESVMRITRRVASAPIPSVIDDPKEIGVQPLEWYVVNVKAAKAVICNFLSDDYEDVKISNAKNAFVAGLAYGLQKPLLMLAQKPYFSPIDYRDLLRVHDDAKQAEIFYQDWLAEILEADKQTAERVTLHNEAITAHGGLLELNVGDPIAEYESEDLFEYFIETSAYADALNGQYSIFVGRKGAGKTATLLKVADHLRADPRNHICVVKPVDYELEGLLSILRQQMTVSEKGFLVESFWKALIYTELAKSVYEHLAAKPEFLGRSKAEEELLDFVRSNEDLILPEFSTRLEALVSRLSAINHGAKSSAEVKAKVSEGVHKTLLHRLRDLLIASLEKTNVVALLVDNLDKNWTPRSDIDLTSELLLALLSVGPRIADEFKKSSLGKRRLDVMMTIFIRSDVYAAILSHARESDKLPIRKIEWNDSELLVRVIEKRIMTSDPSIVDTAEIWERYFEKKVGEIATKDFLIESVFPRPRDLIYLVRASLQNAVNRGHPKILEKDILSGLEQYSSFAFASLMAEGAPQYRSFQDFTTQLFGGPSTLTDDDIREALEESGQGITNLDYVVGLLQDLTFLSYETSPGHFVFGNEQEQKGKLSVLAKKTAKAVGKRRYQIHPAFHAYLELTPVEASGQQPIPFGRPQ